MATPKDFGFYGKGEGGGGGRYAPLRSAESHDRFRADLSRMIALLLAGRRREAAGAGVSAQGGEIASLPAFALTDLDGRPVAWEDLSGRVVLVEFWATWCPPCHGTLAWLAEVKKRHGDRVVVIAPAVESDEADVRAMAASLPGGIRWAMASPDLARAFGDISAVPTLFVFDGDGRAAGVFYGAPPGLQAEAEAAIATLLR